jgi:DNA-binding SARP family transcriptional activator
VLFFPSAVASKRGELACAARLLGASHALQASSRGGRLLAVEQPWFDRIVDVVRTGLDAEAFSHAWREGGALNLEQALDQAAIAVRAGAAPVCTAVAGDRPHRVSSPPLPTPGAVPSAPAAELRVLALGPLEIFRGGELLGTDRWSYAKPRELLIYLLCRPEGATKEQIGQAIWPDATSSQVRNNLHVTLHYLRKALGSADWVLYGADAYRIDRERGVHFDLEIFETQAISILDEPDAPGDARLREVLSLYRGDFLASETFGGWCLEWRDQAASRYVALLWILAERRFTRQEYGAAKPLYRQLAAREELREDIQRRLMQCLARSGERAQALRHGERLVTLLRDELDAEPEPETAELCERLRRAESV